MAREPKLNSLDRYVKWSPRLALEEYGHCEVPAGCGGVVLRWRDRLDSTPVEVNFAVVGADYWTARLDGKVPRTARPFLSPGRHVFTIVAWDVVEAEFAFLAWLRSVDDPDTPLCWTPGPAGAWRACGQEPDAAAWTDAEFDVSAWSECAPAEIVDDRPLPHSVVRLRELGAQPLTVAPGVADEVEATLWLRTVFDVAVAE